MLASDARGMTAAVTELLGLDAAQFNRTIVLPQGRFADFLHDDPGKRQETLRGLLGLGVYREIASAARRRAGERRAQVDAIQAETEADAAALTDERRAALVEHQGAVVAARAAVAEAIAVADAGRSEAAMCDAPTRHGSPMTSRWSARSPRPAGLDDLEPDARRRRRSAGRGDQSRSPKPASTAAPPTPPRRPGRTSSPSVPTSRRGATRSAPPTSTRRTAAQLETPSAPS